jgi:hypothetical protein
VEKVVSFMRYSGKIVSFMRYCGKNRVVYEILWKKSCRLWDIVEKIRYSRTGHRWQYNAHCMPGNATDIHSEYVILGCATMVVRPRLTVTLNVQPVLLITGYRINVKLLNPKGFFTYHQVYHSKILNGVRFALSVLYRSQNRQRVLLYALLTGWFL